MKLELKHIAPYLPYKLAGLFEGEKIRLVSGVTDDCVWRLLGNGSGHFCVPYKKFTPCLRSLSDICNKIQGHELESMTYADLMYLSPYWSGIHDHFKNIGNITLLQYQVLLENHFDVFGLIEKGLAIDINTLNQ